METRLKVTFSHMFTRSRPKRLILPRPSRLPKITRVSCGDKAHPSVRPHFQREEKSEFRILRIATRCARMRACGIREIPLDQVESYRQFLLQEVKSLTVGRIGWIGSAGLLWKKVSCWNMLVVHLIWLFRKSKWSSFNEGRQKVLNDNY